MAFSATAVAVRELSPALSVFEILSIRNALGIVLLLAFAVFRPELRPQLKPRRIKLHLLRNVLHFAGTDGWAYALTLLPLATVFALEFTSPAWVAILAILVSERSDDTRSIGGGSCRVRGRSHRSSTGRRDVPACKHPRARRGTRIRARGDRHETADQDGEHVFRSSS